MALGAFKVWNDIAKTKRRSRTSRRMVCKRPQTLCFEKCEDRNMLAVFTVNSMLDNGDGANVTLREAVIAAVQSPHQEDIIKFDETVFASGGTILLTQGQLNITKSNQLVIDGTNSAGVPLGITIDAGDGADGVFGTFDGHSVFWVVPCKTSLWRRLIS